MKAIYRNPYERKTDIVTIGSTKFLIDGWYNDGKGEIPSIDTPPDKPDFEITTISIFIKTTKGDVPVDITEAIDDLNSLTWRKECHNDIFDYFRERMIDNYVEEGLFDCW